MSNFRTAGRAAMMEKLKTATRQFSPSQIAYMQAKALHEVCRDEQDKYSRLMDEEGVRLGIAKAGDMFVILPEGHAMWERAQALLNRETAASKLLYAAAHNLFDWAIESTLQKCGTEAQKAAIRGMLEKVKEMAYVEQPFEELVDMSMRLCFISEGAVRGDGRKS